MMEMRCRTAIKENDAPWVFPSLPGSHTSYTLIFFLTILFSPEQRCSLIPSLRSFGQ